VLYKLKESNKVHVMGGSTNSLGEKSPIRVSVRILVFLFVF